MLPCGPTPDLRNTRGMISQSALVYFLYDYSVPHF